MRRARGCGRKSVGLDPIVSAQLSEAVPLVNLDWMRAGGFDGSGATVAVLDTGVDGVHPDLAASIVDEHCFCDDGAPGPFGCCPPDFQFDEEDGPGSAQDDHGHGTRVASVVSSDGVYADLGGAPQAGIVAVKVLNASGTGYLSDIVMGINWVRTNHPGIEVLNLSLGFGLYAGDCDDVEDGNVDFVKPAIDLIQQEAGTLVVAGSGNNRSGTHMIAPACLSDVISVGAVWDADVGSRSFFGCTESTAPDKITCWSNGNASTDIVAPGALITASQRSGTATSVAGTSYATPMVSACAALLAHEDPSASLAQLEAALETITGAPLVDAKNGLSYPRLDCVAAYHALPEPGSASSLAAGAALLWLLRWRRERRCVG
jgi:subtilisin family serine protease